MKKGKILVAAAMSLAATAALASCGGSKGPVKFKGDSLSVCLASTPDHVDPALNSAVDGASYAVHLFGNLVRYQPNADGKLELAPDLAKALPTAVKEGDLTTYTFTLRDGIKFSDGTDIKASDVVKSWNRAASYSADIEGGYEGLDADYGYMFDVIDGYSTLADKADAKTLTTSDVFALNVVADDEAKTVKVALTTDVPYFFELCAFPAYAVLKDADKLDNEGAWAKDPSKFVGSGAYKLTSYTKDVKMTITKNDKYWDAANVKQDTINFVFSDDASAQYAQYKAGKLALIDELDADTVLAKRKSSEYNAIGQLGTYYFCWNINGDTFKNFQFTEIQKQEIRQALSLLIDRKSIVNNVTKLGETPSTGFVGAGISDADGSEFVSHNGVNGDGKGWTKVDQSYVKNTQEAVATLKKYFAYDGKKFTNFPTIDYIFNTGDGHKAIAEAIQAQYANFGITVTVRNQDWAVFLNTRKQGNFATARNGWVADYNDPVTFLDMWTSTSGNNDCQLGKGAAAAYNHYELDLTGITGYNRKITGTWSETYDYVIAQIKSATDKTVRFALMHRAENLLMSTGVIAPIYNYVDNWLQSSNVSGVYASPLGYKYFTWSTIEK